MSEKSPHVRLALDAIREYANGGNVLNVPENIADELRYTCAGAFVCIKNNGELRGCIGTIEPTQENLAKEIIQNAISAAFRDPRFLPVDASEVDHLDCTVDVLSPPEPCSFEDLDPKCYGVIVERDMRRGLLLPDLEGIDTPEQQVEIAKRKAFIQPSESVKLYRFEVKRYE